MTTTPILPCVEGVGSHLRLRVALRVETCALASLRSITVKHIDIRSCGSCLLLHHLLVKALQLLLFLGNLARVIIQTMVNLINIVSVYISPTVIGGIV